jgi:hypothetical protein
MCQVLLCYEWTQELLPDTHHAWVDEERSLQADKVSGPSHLILHCSATFSGCMLTIAGVSFGEHMRPQRLALSDNWKNPGSIP